MCERECVCVREGGGREREGEGEGEEWFEVGAFVYKHFDEMSGVSFFLPETKVTGTLSGPSNFLRSATLDIRLPFYLF